MEDMRDTYIETNGIKLHVVEAGPETGELVLLLHGFPEYWYGWRNQISCLAEAGYRVWVPDQRGYNLSDKPAKVKDYQTDELVADVVGLIRASGKERVVLVGHDWGGIVAWQVARSHPELLHRLIILNAPHQAAISKVILRNPGQLIRSAYAGFFQLRGLPEKMLSLSDWRLAKGMLQGTSREGTFADEDLVRYQEAWSQPGAMRSMLNWYRAALRKPADSHPPLRVQVPTLIIWGAKDQFLSRQLGWESGKYCDAGRLVFLEEATHWLHLEEPERVNQLMAEFLREEPLS